MSAWPPLALQHSRSELVAVYDTVDTLSSESDDLVKYLSRFLVVRSCGHLEFTFSEGLALHVEGKAHPHVAAFLRSSLKRGRNPRPAYLVETLRQFKPEWSSGLEDLFADDSEYYGRELEFMVDRRNKIAHGQSEGVGRRKALDLAGVSLFISDWIVDCLDPEK